MEIVLIRHGESAVGTSGNVSAADFGRWVVEYDKAGINPAHKPTDEAFDRAAKSSYVVCSTMPRSIESAKALNIDEINLVSPLFRECEMPYANWNYPTLSITSWSVLFRLLQLVGYSSNAESYDAIKKRAESCVSQLAALSNEHGAVLFVGHGALIWFIHKQLLRMGWSGPKKAARKYWGCAVYNSKTLR